MAARMPANGKTQEPEDLSVFQEEFRERKKCKERSSVHSQDCLRCYENEWSDEKREMCFPKLHEFLSYENDILPLVFIFISAFLVLSNTLIALIFFLFRETPIVRANNRNLSFTLLVSLTLSSMCVFLFLGRPVNVTCMLRHISFGITFSVALSSLLAKTIIVFFAFKATKPDSLWRKCVGTNMSHYEVLIFSSVQVIISVIWLSTSPPFQELDMHSYPGKIIIQCNEGSIFALYSMLSYMGLLATMSFILAYMVRTLPDSFNEAKYITFSMLVFCSVWICAIPAYLSSRGKNMVAVEIFAILSSNTAIASCIFYPKCYIILLKPEENTKRRLLDKPVS
ncbi:vomeronasal type-2 receptor 26-like [Pelobates cultripes]|uniref:Vomeronasal type-2 receptor 26-like n=1 Tax=Pelobates cultripes TaxID=61616 RepID=A0AAD1WCR1_PELCU|nr:vomeronasal type-2 receptor 26-like [Pelobates cultripes]